jgi:MFS transporter, putative metabolite:H+ symporter
MKVKTRVTATIITAALGYFVDIYDLILFNVVRQSSLLAIGIPQESLLSTGVLLLNMQMGGMLVGGILWGILGDKRGRVSVLFGSIFLYSLANVLNAYVTTVPEYATLRFVAGVGLAGELGAAITLVSEIMSKENRGYGTTIVAAFGICGAVLAALIAGNFNWKVAYIVGGVMGFALLALRWGIYESGMYSQLKSTKVKRGNPLVLLKSREQLLRYVNCILIGVPIWFVIGILVAFSPEFATAMGVTEKINAGTSIMYCYIGLAIGDLASGFLSQHFRNRKKVVLFFLMLTTLMSLMYLSWSQAVPVVLASHIYWFCACLGFATGYWAVFVTIGAEQFGTNIRATVTTTVPNFVRGSVVPVSSSFKFLAVKIGVINSGFIVGAIVLTIAFLGLLGLKETFGKDLDYFD